MKYGVLLIGFEYLNSDRWEKLPGIPVDLYQVYRYVSKITKNILVFTDIDKDYNTTTLQRAILDGYVDSGLLSFIEDIKEAKQYIQYNSSKINKYNTNNFDSTMSKFLKGLDRLVIYYTGHGKAGDIILPDDTHVSISYLKEVLLNNVNIDCQIISILDCCESGNMDLPYYYDHNYKTYKLYNLWSGFEESYENNNQEIRKKFIKNEMILLSSSQINQDSSATRSGSLFTRTLFTKYFNNTNSDNVIKINDLEFGDGINIYTSYPNIKIIWNWFTHTKHNNIDVFLDNNNSIITIKLHNCQPTIDKSFSMRDYIRYHHNGRYEN